MGQRCFGHNHFALQNAAGKQCDEAQAHLCAAFVSDHQILAEATLQLPFDGRLVADHRNGAVGKWYIQQVPRIGTLFIRRRAGRGEAESATRDELVGSAQQSRLARLIETEATGFVAGAEPECVDADIRKTGLILRRKAKRLASLGGVEVVRQRNR